ncbi:hypothetical protein KVC85_04730 [Helicobacter pylori]|nr:hypothetical protein KVC85_04730 [Helicobacter pylori]
MRIFKSFKKVFRKPTKLYQRAVLGLGVMFATNQYLMATIDPMAGIRSLESFAKKSYPSRCTYRWVHTPYEKHMGS